MTEPLVVESPHVGALMDIGQRRMLLESLAKKGGAETVGDGFHDWIYGTEGWTPGKWEDAAAYAMSKDPNAWASALYASLCMVQASQTQQELKARLTHLAAMTVAWIEDVDGRTPVGVEP